MALADTLSLPRFAAPKRQDVDTQRWIATVTLPQLFQQWPLLEPVPPGWRESTAEEARGVPVLPRGPVRISILPPSDDARLVALSTAELATAGLAARRPPRVPREARFARFTRSPRPPRPARLVRPARAPRAPRVSRPVRPPRPPRPRRPSRARSQKTKYSTGWCKRPSCFCWTPAGCIGPEMLEAVTLAGLLESSPDCYPGPCYSYEACVTQRCFSETSCVIQGILRFWITQYRAASAYVVPLVVEAVQPIRRVGLRVLIPGPLPVTVLAPPVSEAAGGVTEGCPAGHSWAVGLTGFSCQPIGSAHFRATRAQLIANGIIKGP